MRKTVAVVCAAAACITMQAKGGLFFTIR